MSAPVRTRGLVVLVIGTVAGSAGAVGLLGGLPGRIGIGAAGLLVCWLIFCLLPWAVLPVGIIGGAVASALLDQTEVRSVVITHLALLAAGAMALLTRRLVGLDERRTAPGVLPWPSRLGMIIVIGLVAAGGVYGLAVGNGPDEVLVAGYLVVVIPLYFLAAVHTLDTPHRRLAAGITYLVAITGITAAQFGSAGRHGGLLSLVAVPPLIILAGRYRGWRRLGLAVLAAGLLADVVLAGYRGVWIAGAVAVLIMAVRGGATVRRGVLATGLVGSALTAAVLAAGALQQRATQVADAVVRPAGYRVPEATVGWNVFADSPIVGAGLGQRTPQIYLPGFAVTDVGPAYHAFYVVLLANLGLVGLCLVLWPILRAAWSGVRERDGFALGYAALTVGFLGGAVVSGPTDGHWELGVLPALTLLSLRRRPEPNRRRLPAPARVWRERTA